MDKKEALKLVQESGHELENLPDEFKKDKEIVLAALKEDGSALQYANKKLKADKEVVLAALKQDDRALQYADKKLRADKKVVLMVVKQGGVTWKGALALEYADEKLKADKEVVLVAVTQDGLALKYADKKLRADKEVVLAALKQEVSAHQYIDKKLKGNKDIVLAGKIDDDLLNDMAELLFKNFNSDDGLIIETDIDIIDGEPIKGTARIMILREGLPNDSEYTVTIERVVELEDEDGDEEEDYETIDSYSISLKNHEESIKEFETAIKTYIEYGGSKSSIENLQKQ